VLPLSPKKCKKHQQTLHPNTTKYNAVGSLAKSAKQMKDTTATWAAASHCCHPNFTPQEQHNGCSSGKKATKSPQKSLKKWPSKKEAKAIMFKPLQAKEMEN
jgi:hypothetical protein